MRTNFGCSFLKMLLTFALVGVPLAAQMVSPSLANAQDGAVVKGNDFGAELKRPDGWESAAGNEKALAVFTHSSTQSQIEVVPTKLMTADVAEAFFSTFYKTLSDSNFESEGKPTDKTYGDHSGKETAYKFTHSGVTLKVHVFSFVRGTTAWLVVGYWQDSEAEKVVPAFASTITNLKISK